MAKDRDDDPWRRQREREEEKEQEDVKLANINATRPGSVQGGADKVTELMARAEPMIEQLSNLYNMFVAGVERNPPIERRKQLDQIMNTIQLMSKPTQTLQFRCNTLHNHYQVNRDRWDKLLKDLESGKIKRTAGPKRGT